MQANQLVAVNRDGSVLSPSRNRARTALALAVLGGAVGVLCIVSPAAGIGGAIGGTASVVSQLWWRRRIMRVMQLVQNDELDEAERAVRALAPIRRVRQANVAHLASVIWERRGDLERALGYSEQCSRLLTSPRRGQAIVYWQNLYNRAAWLLELDRLDQARQAIAACERAPTGEWYELQARTLHLRAAFYGAGELATEPELDSWLRDALRYNHTGLQLALLGWALEQRGDLDSAAHAYAEAPSRFLKGIEMVARIYPRAWKVIGPKLEAAPATADEA